MVEIKCINKEDRDNPYERITHVWWVNHDWNKWKKTQKEIIDYINSWKHSFYVNVWRNKINVIVSKSRFWNEYIKTENDRDEPNNLLSLPECDKKINLFDFKNL